MDNYCPVCKIPLAGKNYDGVKYLECSQCAGIWIYDDDLKRLESENVQDLNTIDSMNVPMHPVGSPVDLLACPECGNDLVQFHFLMEGPIILHRCDPCKGLWIGDGELVQMAAAIKAANLPPTPAEIHSAANAATEAQFDQEHAATMARCHMISNVCRQLSTRVGYGWF